jgi:hypothetical protein
MLTVPERFNDGLVLLLATPSGSAILESASLARAIGVEVAGFRAHGEAVDGTTIRLTNAQLDAANQACILAHELTHRLDLAFWNCRREEWTPVMVGATEINAHYNQGLVARELAKIRGLANVWADQVAVMNRSGMASGKLYDARDRFAVYTYLTTTQQYGPKVEALKNAKILYLWTKDDQWEDGCKRFHCEAHLAATNPVGGRFW